MKITDPASTPPARREFLVRSALASAAGLSLLQLPADVCAAETQSDAAAPATSAVAPGERQGSPIP